MNPSPTNPSEDHLRELARQFQYPPTPDVARGVLNHLDSGSRQRVRRRGAWAVVVLLVLLLAVTLFAVPGVRAEIVRFFQVGVVRIFPATATQTELPALPQSPKTATPAAILPDTATPQLEATPSEAAPGLRITDLAGNTALETAQAEVPFPIRLPAYPADLGEPNRVFLQEDSSMVILVWTEQGNPQKARLSLYEIGPGSLLIRKFAPHIIQETQVNGQYAVWVEGPYLVQLSNGSYELRQTVPGNTLIWEEADITYRLESGLSLDDAVKIAESLR